jgi:hypothetical protein
LANARLNIAAVSSGLVAAAAGTALAAFTGSGTPVLYLAAALLLTGGVLALRLPERVDEEPRRRAGGRWQRPRGGWLRSRGRRRPPQDVYRRR